MLFQEKLKELRKEKKISQYDLAEALNISRSVVAKWETGLTLPSEESTRLLMEYFNVSREELFNNEETETIIVKKNVSISKMKKLIISLSSALVVLIITIVIVLTSAMPKSLSKQLDKLGNLDEVKISLYHVSTGERYYLDPTEDNIKDKSLSLLEMVEYKFYPKYKIVEPAWLGSYTITLEGDITIHINEAFLIIDGENRAVKQYTVNNINKVIKLLIDSESIEIIDEKFSQHN